MSGVDAATVTLLATLGGIIPLFVGLIAANLLSSSKRTFTTYAAALSVGVLLSTFYDIMQETAGLQVGSPNFLFGFLSLLVFLLGFGILLVSTPSKHGKDFVVTLALAFGWAVGLALHGFGEGIVIGYGFISGDQEYSSLSQILSFGLHKMAEGFTLGTLLAVAKTRTRDWLVGGLIAGLPVGLGGLLGFSTTSILGVLVYAFAAGAGFTAYFLILFCRMIPERNRAAYVVVALGFVFMYFAGLLHQF